MQTSLKIVTSLAGPSGERKARKCLQFLIAVSRRDPSIVGQAVSIASDLTKGAGSKAGSFLRRDDDLVLLISYSSLLHPKHLTSPSVAGLGK